MSEFLSAFRAEHGSLHHADAEFLEPFLRESFVTEGHVTPEEIDGLVMGVEDADGYSVSEELAARFPRLSTLAQFGLTYDEDDIRKLLGR